MEGKLKGKIIDYLFEDPVINNQKYALVSIVGPTLKQKCEIFGLKVRGVADTLEKAKEMTKKIMRVDNNYDIYTVEVGKFFPLTVDPHKIENVEYENEQLNTLIKSYLENRESANELWEKRKNDMISEAIREGKNQEELANKEEPPLAVLQRIKTQEKDISDLQEQIDKLKDYLDNSVIKYNKFTNEEKQLAELEINKVNENVEEIETSTEAINNDITKLLDELKLYEYKLEQLETETPINLELHNELIEVTKNEIENIKGLLKEKDINKYINSNFGDSPYNTL